MAVTGIGDYNNAYENVYTEAGFSKNQIFSQGRGFQGVAISPAYLAKAGKNEDTAKDLDEMLSGVEKAYNWLKNSIEKDGNKLISCGYYIDENGKMGSYSVVEKKHSMFDSLEVQSEKDAERIKELRKKREIFGHSLEISQESKEFMAGVKERKAAQIAAMEAAKPKENGNVFEGSGDFKKQFVFFSENLSRNGFYRGFSEDEVRRVEGMLENITSGMDSLNKVSINRNVMTEISHEAAELELISSVNALTYFADKYVPEEIRDSFLETVNQYKSYNSQIVAAHKNIYDLRDESMAEIPLPIAKNVSAAVKKTQEDTRASREIGKVKHTKEQEEEHKREYQSYFDRLVQGKESPETVFDSLQNVLVNYASGGSKNSHVLAMLNSRNYGEIQNMCCYWSKLFT